MRRMMGKEAIVEDDVGIEGRKRVNDCRDAYPAKRAKEAVDCRNLAMTGYKVEGERAGNGIREKEEEFNNKLERLRGLLKDDPDKLRKKDIEDVIRYLDVGDIVSLALSSSRVKEKGTMEDRWYIGLVNPCFVPSPEKVGKLVRIMLLCGIEELKAVDLFILFNNFSKAGFASMLLPALKSYNKRRPDGDESLYSEEMCANVYDLCCVLPWELFAHVMYKLTSLSLFEYSTSTISTSKEEKEEEIHKKAAENCDICYGKGKHSGIYGYHCSYWHTVPYGATIGSSHNLHCRDCCDLFVRRLTFKGCSCGSMVGYAVPQSLQWKSW